MKTIFGKKSYTGCWQTIVESNIGHSHIQKNIPNQDAVCFFPNKDNSRFYVIALADGHGAAECIRSDTGSKLAVKIATKIGSSYVKNSIKMKNLMNQEKKLNTLIKSIVMQWKKAATIHLKRNPLDLNEQKLLDKIDLKKKDKIKNNNLVYYGSTLLMALVRDNNLVLLQIGDGDICLVNSDNSVSMAFSHPKEFIANETHSLCMKRSETLFQSNSFFTDCLNLIILSSDGYSNSFSTRDDFLQVGNDIHEMILKHCVASLKVHLPDWLNETSKMGSGDDITVAILYKKNINE